MKKKEDISAAYERRVNTPQVIDDIEEETVSDEPVLTSLSDKTEPFAAEEPAPPVSEGDLPEVRQKEEPKPPANPMYARYMSAQRDKPDAVVLIRLGNFYEVMGERAREVSEWLNLTLTSRDVGLSERVPMCGFPYHVTEQYLQAILEHRGVYVLEPDAEPIYILSRAELSESESLETAPVSEEEQPFDETELSELQEILSSELADGQAAERPVLTEIEDGEPNPFDEQEPEDEPDETDWEWGFNVISNILTNERYCGDMLLQKTFTENCITKKVKKNRGEMAKYFIANNHVPIVSSEMFKKVQREMARRRGKRQTSDKGITSLGKYSGKFALSELLVCGECGSPYKRVTWVKNGVSRKVWRCLSRVQL